MKNKSMTFGDGTESVTHFLKANSNDYVLSPTLVSASSPDAKGSKREVMSLLSKSASEAVQNHMHQGDNNGMVSPDKGVEIDINEKR